MNLVSLISCLHLLLGKFLPTIFKLYHLADKNDFKFESNPILPILNRFKANFGIEILKKKKTLA